jgi:hypothetical protein
MRDSPVGRCTPPAKRRVLKRLGVAGSDHRRVASFDAVVCRCAELSLALIRCCFVPRSAFGRLSRTALRRSRHVFNDLRSEKLSNQTRHTDNSAYGEWLAGVMR